MESVESFRYSFQPWRLKIPVTRLFVHQLFQNNISFKLHITGLLYVELIPFTKTVMRFPLMKTASGSGKTAAITGGGNKTVLWYTYMKTRGCVPDVVGPDSRC